MFLLKTRTFEKKGKISIEKKGLTIFSRIIEHEKPQETV